MNDTRLTPPPAAEAQPSLLERWRARVEYQGLSLAAVCALVASFLLLGDRLTHAQIAARQQEDRLAVLRQVLPAELYDNNPLRDAYRVEDRELGEVEVYPARQGDLLTAVAFQVSNIGYGGPIVHLVALDARGRVLGVRVLAHKETPGLADKIEAARSDWIKGFDGLSLANTPLEKWKVKKDGGQFDQFAGATITPRAVVKSVLQALQFQVRQAERLGMQPEEVQP